MTDDKDKHLFISLIYNFQMQTMMQLGKLANPMTGKSETELEGAQITIDLLDMLKSKTKGNLSDDETRFLDQILADLKLNFLEEKVKMEKESEGAEQKSVEEKKQAEDEKKPPVDDEKKPDEQKKPPVDKKEEKG